MPVAVKPEDLPAIYDLIVEHVARVGRQRATIEYLFAAAIKELEDEKLNGPSKKMARHIGDYDLAIDVWKAAEATNAVRVAIGRLREGLEAFYRSDPIGRRQPLKAVIGPNGYALTFEKNIPPPMAHDRVRDLWAPYLLSDRPVRIYYSQPVFLQDSKNTNFYNPAVQDPDSEGLSYLGITERLRVNHAFVSSRSVQSLLCLLDCFQRNDTPVIAASLRSQTATIPEDDEDVILIGTPSAIQSIKRLEASLPMRSLPDGVSYQTQEDGEESRQEVLARSFSESGAVETHWTLFSRRAHRFKGRYVSIFSGTHEKAIEATVSFMTRQRELKDLLQHFTPQSFFSEHFQVIFKVGVVSAGSESTVDSISIFLVQ